MGVGATFCHGALEGASLNVYINTRLMKDRALAQQMEQKADSMLAKWLPRASQVVEAVTASLRK